MASKTSWPMFGLNRLPSASRGVIFSAPLRDTHDGLRGFELEDADGYVLFFGRPRT